MNKFSFIIPFRNRHHHLKVLVPRLREISAKQNMDIEILVAEQVDDGPFRHGGLKNEVAKIATGNIIITHDVDYIPEDDVVYWPNDAFDLYTPVRRVNFINSDGTPRQEEDTPSGYRHFKQSVDNNFFGGAICVKREIYFKVNGYSPMYEGWGMDDEDYRERLLDAGFKINRGDGTFKAQYHKDSFKNTLLFKRSQHIFANRSKFRHIGLKNVKVTSYLNEEKAKQFNVDKWLEITDWIIAMEPQIQPRIVTLSYGHFALLPNVGNDLVQRTVYQGKLWEPGIMALCQKYVIPSSTVIDVGANIGTFTVWLSHLVGVDGKVYAFEPQRIIYQQLCCNIFLNNLRNVYSYQAVVGKSTGAVTITPVNYDDGSPREARIVDSNEEHGEKAQCISLDYYGLKNVSLIKIDAKKYEHFVFDGSKETIQKNRPVILFKLTALPLPDYPKDFVILFLKNMNYNIYEISGIGDYLGIPKEKDSTT